MAGKAALAQSARELHVYSTLLANCKDVDAVVHRLERWIKKAVAQHIPYLTLAPSSVLWWANKLTQLVNSLKNKKYGETLCTMFYNGLIPEQVIILPNPPPSFPQLELAVFSSKELVLPLGTYRNQQFYKTFIIFLSSCENYDLLLVSDSL
jgi:hypothetical protein